MSYTVPVTFVAENGDQSAGQLDSCYAAVLLGVNNAFLVGTLGARPAPDGIGNGRYYLATDDNGGQLYRDNGSAWVKVAPPVNSAQSSIGVVRGLVGVNNAGAPNTKYDIAMAAVTMYAPSTLAAFLVNNPAAFTIDTALAGPALNGRDQAGAFGVSTWLHLYAIGNGTLIGGTMSTTAPPTGPALPAGYTFWKYLGAVFFDASSHLVKTRITQDYAAITPVIVRASAVGTAAEQSYDISANIPPNHLGAALSLTSDNSAQQADILASASGDVVLTANTGGVAAQMGLSGRVPLAAQTVFFIATGATHCAIFLNGYWMPV